MSGQMVRRQSGVLVPVWGGSTATIPEPVDREDLVPGTYEAGPSNTGLLPGYTWDESGMYFEGVLIPGSVLNGDQSLSGAARIDNKVINGRVACNGIGNVIKNCVVRGTAAGPPDGAGNGQGLVTVGVNGRLARIEDCELVPQKPHYNMNGIYSHDFVALRCNIYRCVDLGNAWAANIPTNAEFQACWMHSMTLFNPDPNHASSDNRTHNDGIQLQGGIGTVINGCTIEGYLENWTGSGFNAATSDVTTNPPNIWASPHKFSQSGQCVSNACVILTVNVGTQPRQSGGFTITNNLFKGGASALNFVDVKTSTGAQQAAGALGSIGTIQGNRFYHDQGEQGTAAGTPYNPNSTTGFTIRVGAVWTTEGISNNVYYDTGLPVQVRTGLRNN